MVSFFSENKEIELEEGIDVICAGSIESMTYLNGLLENLKIHFNESYEHSRYTALWARAIAEELHMEQEDIKRIYACGLLHDLGKINIPQHILAKPGTLTTKEYEVIKSHAMASYLLIKEHVTEDIANAVFMHHERLDGSGYPRQLKGNIISDYAKILMVADSFDAMIVHRVYQRKSTYSEALLELRKQKDKYEMKYIEALERVIVAKKGK